MAELKTKMTAVDPAVFVAAIEEDGRREDAKALLRLFKQATGLRPKMWGASIIGYGQYHYKSERSRQEGDWPLTGFSPRKQALSIYIMPGSDAYPALMKRLGKFRTGASCLYVNKLADIDLGVLERLIRVSVVDMKQRYGVK